MKKNATVKLICLTLAALLTFSTVFGCGASDNSTVDNGDAQDNTPVTGSTSSTVSSNADDKFTLRFTEDDSLNPFTCTNVYNDAVTSLMYEGLFRLDNSFQPVNVLCKDYATDDGLTYTLNIIDAKLHDGVKLTVEDVVYSINQARIHAKFSTRLSNISYCGEDENGSLRIELTNSDYNLPSLLDIPIIKYGSVDNEHPVGTGPYCYKRSNGTDTLILFEQYRTADSITLDRIYLAEFTDAAIEESFANAALDCIWEDTAGESPVNLYSSHEARYYNTSILQYIGFNSSSVFKDANLRLAVSYAVDRQYVINDIYDGNATSASLILHPEHYLYSDTWEQGFEHSSSKLSSCLAASGLDDKNGDGYLEYPVDGNYQPFEINFVVYEGNDKKLSAAEDIADNLRNVGLNVKLTALSWSEYTSALLNGNFDMYYAEVAITRNFDFSSILSPGGSLDYGNIGSSEYYTLCRNFLSAATEEEKLSAAQALCIGVAQSAPIIPIMYRQYVTYTHRGVLSNFSPSVSGVFSDAAGWTVKLN